MSESILSGHNAYAPVVIRPERIEQEFRKTRSKEPAEGRKPKASPRGRTPRLPSTVAVTYPKAPPLSHASVGVPSACESHVHRDTKGKAPWHLQKMRLTKS